MNSSLTRMYEHLRWANDRILNALKQAEPLPDKPMTLFSHMLAAEQVWLARINGQDNSGLPIWPELKLEACEQLMHQNQQGFDRVLNSLNANGDDLTITYKNSKGMSFSTSIRDILIHVAMHGSYHRGQMSSYLKLEGFEPVNTDFITFTR